MSLSIPSSFFTSGLYQVMLYSAMLPSAYFIMMVIGKLRHKLGFSIITVVYKTLLSWLSIVCIWITVGFIFSYSMQDLGLLKEANFGSNPFIRYYPVAVLIIATAGFYYPHADYFNLKRSPHKSILLFVLCFTPLYLMLVYSPFVDQNLWKTSLLFGFRSSLFAFAISYPIIFQNKPSSFRQALNLVTRFLFTPTNQTPQ